jgi:hypothetical protein
MRYATSVRSALSKLAQGDPGLLSEPTIHLVQKLLGRILFDEFEDDVSIRLSPGLVLRQSLTNEDRDGDGCSRCVRRHNQFCAVGCIIASPNVLSIHRASSGRPRLLQRRHEDSGFGMNPGARASSRLARRPSRPTAPPNRGEIRETAAPSRFEVGREFGIGGRALRARGSCDGQKAPARRKSRRSRSPMAVVGEPTCNSGCRRGTALEYA